MDTSKLSARATAGAAFLLGLAIPLAGPVYAAEPREACRAASPQKPAKKKDRGFGGLLSAAKRAGVGNVLGSGILGDGRAAQVAGAVTSTAVEVSEGGAAASAITDLPDSSRTAKAVGAAAATAIELARQAPLACEPAN